MSDGAKKSANVYIKNCYCRHIDFMERDGISGKTWTLGNEAEKSRSNIMIDEKSKVDELITYKDNVYIHSAAEIEKYAGVDTNIQGQDITEINAFKRSDVELATKDLLPEVFKDNITNYRKRYR